MRSRAMSLALAGLGLAGCVDLEEHPLTGVSGAYFGTPEGATAAVTGAYALQRKWAGYNEYRVFFLGTDSWEKGDQAQAPAQGDDPFNDYTAVLAPSMTNTALRDLWRDLYKTVDATNTAIHYISASTQIPEPMRSRRLAEARFLRALHYFFLVRMWGAVPLSFEPTTGVVTTATRTSADSIYELAIIPDLQFAADTLPVTPELPGRATKGAARTLLAEVYLTRGQPGDFDRARDLATAVIESKTYELATTFRGLFCGTHYPEACEFVPESEPNKEIIYAVQFSTDDPHYLGGNVFHVCGVMAYEGTNAASSLLLRRLEYGRGYRRIKPTSHLLNLWNRATDSRYDATFQTLWKQPNGDTAIYFPGTDTVPTVYRKRPFKAYGQSQYTSMVYPSLKKWLDDKRKNAGDLVSGRDRHLWRLADVYLLRAEANIRAGRVADARADFNVLRARAAIPGKDNTLSEAEIAQLNADPIDFLLDERERELAGEEQRWFVLTRLGKLVDRVQAYNAAGARNVKSYHELRPIPQEQIDRTRGGAAAFPQNPGY